MLKRKIYNQLLKWKEDRKKGLKKCLIIKGARQVGKTYIIKEFGLKEYESFVYINFYEKPILKEIFNETLTAEEIFKRMTAYINDIKFIKGNTLIFLDEIQCCGNARTAIKFLSESFDYDVISSGSLLGLSYSDLDEFDTPLSIPVGYETQLVMHSLDFEEFLWANGYNDESISLIKEYFVSNKEIPSILHKKYEDLFKEFIIVGGMPEVVQDFVINKDYSRVFDLQMQILSEYQDDISKHAKGKKKEYVRKTYSAVPKQLAKELKKFQYSTIESKQTRRKYGGSVKWLEDSQLVNVCYNVREPMIPLLGNANDEQFKLYINDTGLLTAIYGKETKLAILNNSLKGSIKRGIYENVIGECLVKKGFNLYYYKPNDSMKIEFLIEKDGEVIPIEVKATNSQTPSLNSYIKKFNPSITYKLINGKNGRNENKISIPHYMILFI